MNFLPGELWLDIGNLLDEVSSTVVFFTSKELARKMSVISTSKKTIFNEAVLSGNLEVMKYLKDQPCSWNVYTFSAAEYGSIVNMKRLREEGCPWDESTFYAAAKNAEAKGYKLNIEYAESVLPQDGPYRLRD